ncbi:hypothetical protein CRG98_032168 [Punica granatum]|uniref:Uncharacterized protein n=1 Tax=Punica granatum TaxID=22663 RepID=A0A2I0ITY7_PUNGR|nr:hypothetical protein CRG98_032168 [Punica granatum]
MGLLGRTGLRSGFGLGRTGLLDRTGLRSGLDWVGRACWTGLGRDPYWTGPNWAAIGPAKLGWARRWSTGSDVDGLGRRRWTRRRCWIGPSLGGWATHTHGREVRGSRSSSRGREGD